MTTSFVQQSFSFGGGEPPRAASRRNAVIEAGAGTGKTTRIVREVVLRLLHEPDLQPERIVLVTFTEKAAAEIADRVRWALTELFLQQESERLVWPSGSPTPILEFGAAERDQILAAAEAQLQRIDRLKSQTIHSFCQSVVRSYAIEAGIDPRFRIVQGFEQSQLMNEVFDQWLASETTDPDAIHLREWRHAIERLGRLDAVRQTVIALLSKRELIDDHRYTLGVIDDLHESLGGAIQTLAALAPEACTSEVATLVNAYFRQNLPPADADLDAWIRYLDPISEVLRACDLNHFKSAKPAIRLLRGEKRERTMHDQLLQHQAAVAVRALARRYAQALDGEKKARGVLDFDDLLILTDRLLDDESILRDVRRRCQYIFVDEFQDTDRVQARIIDRLARDDDGKFVAGKTVLVGDPKQSIYSFRRADPEMFLRTLERFVLEGADREFLEHQYRSDAPLVASINAMFARLFPEGAAAASAHVARPTYRPLIAGRRSQHRDGEARIRFVGADLPEGEDRDWAEAETVADFIQRHAAGEFRKFAVLMRKMTNSAVYSDVFARRGIPLVIPPGRAFLDQPAVVDMLSVLRAIAFPFDRGSLVSAARSPYFALSDQDIARHFLLRSGSTREEGAGVAASLPGDLSASGELAPTFAAEGVGESALLEGGDSPFLGFEKEIERYASAARHLRVAELIDRIVEQQQIETTLSVLRHGARDLAQLRRFRDLASEYDLTTAGSLRQFVTELGRRRSSSDETEPVWADETANAVRMMTIHASKGLEFHTVIMPDLGSGTRGDDVNVIVVDEPPTIAFTGQIQSISAEHHVLGGETLKAIERARDEAEVSRLFYVGVTRAKSDVVFVTTTSKKKTESFWKPLTAIFGFEVKTVDAIFPVAPGETLERFDLGGQTVDVVFERATMPERSSTEVSRFLDDDFERLLQVDVQEPAPHAAETTLSREELAIRRAALRKRSTGIVIHRLLEFWSGEKGDLEPAIERVRGEFALQPRELDEIRKRFHRISGSAMLQRIRASIAVEKEMPLLFIDDEGNAREGRIDLLIREEGRLTVVDYKSGELGAERLEKDSAQVRQYCAALKGMTEDEVTGLLWYLDDDRVIDVEATEVPLAAAH